MALKQHLDDKVRFDQQVENSGTYILPFIQRTKAINSATKILEVGTGEGGVLLPFIKEGCYCVGEAASAAKGSGALEGSEADSGLPEQPTCGRGPTPRERASGARSC